MIFMAMTQPPVAKTLPPIARELLLKAAAVPGDRARIKAIDAARADIARLFPKLVR